MADKTAGLQTIKFTMQPKIISTANIVGPFEGKGPLKEYYDYIMPDSLNGHESWEKCESFMMEWAIKKAVEKAGLTIDKIDYILAGDLLNQLTSTHFAVRNINRPLIGLYGACSTLAEGTALGACLIDGGFADKVCIAVSSHHDTAERQYRFPSELGVQRPPLAQWTVTGAGALVLSSQGHTNLPKITAATFGKIIDMGIKDTNAMGPAMAPAALDTLSLHFKDLNIAPSYYDKIYTGDLGVVGKTLLLEMMNEQGIDISQNYEDCGCMIYYDDQDTHAGASGCASSAVVLTGYLYAHLLSSSLRKIMIIGTGSLHSPTSYQQKESIPCIAHAVSIEV